MSYFCSQTIMAVAGGTVVLALILAITLSLTLAKDSALEDAELEAAAYIDKLDQATALRRTIGTLAEWQYGSNVTDENDDNRVRRLQRILYNPLQKYLLSQWPVS